MASATITQLPQAIGVTGTEYMEAVQAGTSVRVTASMVAALGAPKYNVNRTTSVAYTVVDTDQSIAFTGGGSTIITLPLALSYPGREITVKMEVNQTLTSGSANVVPLVGGAAGTAILSAAAGKYALLKSDGTNWTTMMAN